MQEVNPHIPALSPPQDTRRTHRHQLGILASLGQINNRRQVLGHIAGTGNIAWLKQQSLIVFRIHLGQGLCITYLQELFPFIPSSNSLPIDIELPHVYSLALLLHIYLPLFSKKAFTTKPHVSYH